jgi:hypothetical protein
MLIGGRRNVVGTRAVAYFFEKQGEKRRRIREQVGGRV